MQVTRKLAKATREKDVPRYRIRDEAKTDQDQPSQGMHCQIPSKRAGKAICYFWGSAELSLVFEEKVEDGRSLRANNACPISGEAAVPHSITLLRRACQHSTEF